jgi:hypothetical protein
MNYDGHIEHGSLTISAGPEECAVSLGQIHPTASAIVLICMLFDPRIREVQERSDFYVAAFVAMLVLVNYSPLFHHAH